MDTPDKAAGLADSQIAEALNRDWLLSSSCSIRDSQLEANLRSYQQLSLSINDASSSSDNTLYGSVPLDGFSAFSKARTSNQHSKRRVKATDETSGLLSGSGRRTVNYHLYDNIGFADSPLLAGSITDCHKTASFQGSAGGDNEYKQDSRLLAPAGDDLDAANTGCFRGKFRIFLACYVLIGITLAIYSRTALSLAAVGMVANNVADKELVNILAASIDKPAVSNLSITTAIQNSDGSCLILDRHLASRNRKEEVASRLAVANVASYLPAGVHFNQAHRYQIEQAFRASIKQRVASGELVDWSPSEQGLIFAAGSVGNLLISIPITRLGEIYGPKWVIFVALLGATIQAALMPLVSPLHLSLVILFQMVFSGLAFGADCVAYTLFAYWLTPTEIAFFVACLVVCYQLGAILSSVITSQILTRALDWSWCFYVPALLCGLWSFVWMFIGASEPSSSSIITRKELDYIAIRSKLSQASRCHSTGSPPTCSQSVGVQQDDAELPASPQQRRPVSWLKLAKDPNIWAIIAVKFTLRWYFSVNISLMPTYLSSVAHMSVDTIGKLSALQSIIGLVSGILMGYLTKSVVSKRPFNLSLAAFRKIFQSVVNFGLAGSLVIFTTFDCDQWVTMVTLTVACICVNFHVAAALQLPLDLSPDYCGLITSITNTLALGQAIGAPISGLIVNSAPKDRNLWRIVWGIAVLLNVMSGILFIFLVNSKPKDFSRSKSSKTKKNFIKSHC